MAGGRSASPRASGVFVVADVTHLVDLSKEWNMTVTIHFEGWPGHVPLMSEPICLICKDPRTCDRALTLLSGAVYKISFLCKDLSRLRISAEKNLSMTKVAIPCDEGVGTCLCLCCVLWCAGKLALLKGK